MSRHAGPGGAGAATTATAATVQRRRPDNCNGSTLSLPKHGQQQQRSNAVVAQARARAATVQRCREGQARRASGGRRGPGGPGGPGRPRRPSTAAAYDPSVAAGGLVDDVLGLLKAYAGALAVLGDRLDLLA